MGNLFFGESRSRFATRGGTALCAGRGAGLCASRRSGPCATGRSGLCAGRGAGNRGARRPALLAAIVGAVAAFALAFAPVEAAARIPAWSPYQPFGGRRVGASGKASFDPARAEKAAPRRGPNPTLNRLGTRPTVGGWEFHDTVTGLPFRPRGHTFVRIADYAPPVVLYPPVDFRAIHGPLANVQGLPGYYDPADADAEFAAMAAAGYNVVRTMVDGSYHNPANVAPGERFSAAFVANIVDLLYRARLNGLYTILSPGWLPPTYDDVVEAPCAEIPPDPNYATTTIDVSGAPHSVCSVAWAEGYNAQFMHRGIVEADGLYIADLLEEISKLDPNALDGLMGVEVWNEPFFTGYEAPFSTTSGTLTVELDATRTYDMSLSPAGLLDRQRLCDDAARHWAESVLATVRGRHPTVLLTAPIFTPYGTGRSGYKGMTLLENAIDPRQPPRVRVWEEAGFDYIDVHAYPVPVWANPYHLAAEAASAELDLLPPSAPRIMGEMGVNRGYLPSSPLAIDALKGQMEGSCPYGFGGWIVFTWDDDLGWWTALDDGGAIRDALSPAAFPWPCGGPSAACAAWGFYE